MRDPSDPLRAARDAVEVRRGDADDLAEPERDDREVVTAQTQHGQAEDDTGEHREADTERQDLPRVQVRELQRPGPREDGDGVRADRPERDVAEIEQTGETDDDVQPHGEQREQTPR